MCSLDTQEDTEENAEDSIEGSRLQYQVFSNLGKYWEFYLEMVTMLASKMILSMMTESRKFNINPTIQLQERTKNI